MLLCSLTFSSLPLILCGVGIQIMQIIKILFCSFFSLLHQHIVLWQGTTVFWDFFREYCNSVKIICFSNDRVFKYKGFWLCSLKMLISTNFSAFLISCSSKRLFGNEVSSSFGTNGNGTIQNKSCASLVWMQDNSFRLSFRFNFSHAVLRVSQIWHKQLI